MPQPGAPNRGSASKAPKLVLWGTGKPYRELLHVDDLASACLFIMQQPDAALAEVGRVASSNSTAEAPSSLRPETCLLNIGTGDDLTIRELADLVKDVVGFNGDVVWDTSRPDGTPKKQLDVSRLQRLGWWPALSLRDGIEATYRDYRQASG